jgi:hypothetical protein
MEGWILWEGPSQPFLWDARHLHSFLRHVRRPPGNAGVIDPKPQIGYQRSMINIVPTFRSTMMMPLSIPEAGHFGM